MPRGGSKSGGGGSKGSGGGGTVSVSGYTRSNGTVVAGYTRSSPGSGASSGGSSGTSLGASNTVSVSGYTRSNGTYVSGYTRAAPGTSSSKSYSSSSPSSNKVHVSGYTRSDGTEVSAYTRSAPKSVSKTSSSSSSNDKLVHVSGYTKANGTQVDSYVRSPPSMDKTTITVRCYADNAYNRNLRRVGKPLGTCIVGKDASKKSETAQQYEQCMEEHSLGDLIKALQNLTYFDPSHSSHQYAVDQLQRETVEEDWKKLKLDPSTSAINVRHNEILIPFNALKLDKIIGKGGFGEVYAARWDASGHETPVAFKKLLHQRMSKKQLDEFLKEVTILAGISHPHVIKMFGAVVEDNNIGIVMEYLKCSLYRAVFIACVHLSDSEKRKIICQVADALKYLHTCDCHTIAHCDVKSENILLNWQGNAKLCDFGLSAVKNNTESSRSNTAGVVPGQGTPRYSAPEVLRGEILNIDQLLQADVYSLAVVVFEVITEEEPFHGLGVRQLQVNVGDGTMLPTTHASNVVLPSSVEDLLNMCWERDGKMRPSAAEFHAKWSSLIMNP